MKKFPLTVIYKHGRIILLQSEITDEFKRWVRENCYSIGSINSPDVGGSTIFINGDNEKLNYKFVRSSEHRSTKVNFTYYKNIIEKYKKLYEET